MASYRFFFAKIQAGHLLIFLHSEKFWCLSRWRCTTQSDIGACATCCMNDKACSSRPHSLWASAVEFRRDFLTSPWKVKWSGIKSYVSLIGPEFFLSWIFKFKWCTILLRAFLSGFFIFGQDDQILVTMTKNWSHDQFFVGWTKNKKKTERKALNNKLVSIWHHFSVVPHTCQKISLICPAAKNYLGVFTQQATGG